MSEDTNERQGPSGPSSSPAVTDLGGDESEDNAMPFNMMAFEPMSVCEFLRWDPFGLDREHYPQGMWNRTRNSPTVTSGSSWNGQSAASQEDAESTLRTGSQEATTPPLEDVGEDIRDENRPSSIKQSTYQASNWFVKMFSGEVEEAKDTPHEDIVAEQKEGKGKQKASTETVKECAVCLELVARTSFRDTHHAAACEASSDVCLSCWDKHIGNEIRSKNLENISCLQCSHALTKEEVRHLASNSTYAE